MSRCLRASSLLLLAATLCGCGQTGPLHQPADAPANEDYLLVRKRKAAANPPPASPEPSPAPANANP